MTLLEEIREIQKFAQLKEEELAFKNEKKTVWKELITAAKRFPYSKGMRYEGALSHRTREWLRKQELKVEIPDFDITRKVYHIISWD